MLAAERSVLWKEYFVFILAFCLLARPDLEGSLAEPTAFRERVPAQAYSKIVDVVRGGFGGRVESRHIPERLAVPFPSGGDGQVAELEMSVHPHRIQKRLGDPASGVGVRVRRRKRSGFVQKRDNSRKVALDILTLKLFH